MADEDDLPYQTLQADDGTPLVEIASTANSDEAELIKGFLEAEGIAAQVEYADAKILPANIGKLGDIRVFVAEEDEERAFELLKKRNDDYENLDDDDDTVVTDEGVAEIDDDARAETES